MSSTEDTASKEDNDVLSVCANCGKGEEESDRLKACTACKLVKYCNRECQIAHRPQHKKECRKRAAELHDEKLFAEPPSQWGDCPVCFLRIPSLHTGSKYMTCCGKVICSGCYFAPVYDNQGNTVAEKKCAFCRTPIPKSNKEENKRLERRVEINDPIAMCNLGVCYARGLRKYPQDHAKAIELFRRSAELGFADAYASIGYAYEHGEGVEVDIDKKEAVHYCELAAIGGSVVARSNLGNNEVDAGNIDRALKHYMIATRGGYANSLKNIKILYSKGDATKDTYTKALKVYQTYLDEIKSVQRDKAAAALEDCCYY